MDEWTNKLLIQAEALRLYQTLEHVMQTVWRVGAEEMNLPPGHPILTLYHDAATALSACPATEKLRNAASAG